MSFNIQILEYIFILVTVVRKFQIINISSKMLRNGFTLGLVLLVANVALAQDEGAEVAADQPAEEVQDAPVEEGSEAAGEADEEQTEGDGDTEEAAESGEAEEEGDADDDEEGEDSEEGGEEEAGEEEEEACFIDEEQVDCRLVPLVDEVT